MQVMSWSFRNASLIALVDFGAATIKWAHSSV